MASKKAPKKSPKKFKAKKPPEKPARQSTNPRYLNFVHNFFYGPKGIVGNALKSAVEAGYSLSMATGKAQAWVGNSRKKASNKAIWDLVQSERQKVENEYELSEKEILKQYKSLCTFDIRKLFDEHGKLIPIHLLDNDTAAAISGFDVSVLKTTVSGETIIEESIKKIKFADKKGALDSMVKIKGMSAPEKHEHTGKDGGPIETKMVEAPPVPKDLAEWEAWMKASISRRAQEEAQG